MKKISKQYQDKEALELALLAGKAALDKKAENLVVLDVREISGFADYFVIMSGRSTRHVQGLAQAIDDEIGSKRLKAGNTEGLTEGLWVLLDYNDVIVHVFYNETREFYDLEGLWHDAPRVEVPGQ
ncbi:MAG: ribosome silencing factor [Proteobacteria bacterium]|nr:ribosome silencing factor [Pseudomonadota bacterium]MBU1716348.1 ribosome silencing factor [Pseudomonadota bacterium]